MSTPLGENAVEQLPAATQTHSVPLVRLHVRWLVAFAERALHQRAIEACVSAKLFHQLRRLRSPKNVSVV